MRTNLCALGSFFTLAVAPTALAREATAETTIGAAGVAADASSEAAPATPAKDSYLKRHRPRANLFEAGLFGGFLIPSDDHGLHDESRPHGTYNVAGEIGLRLAYFPTSFLGAEMEAAALPTSTDDADAAGLWSVRGHGVLQLPTSSITPFVLIGGGAWGAASDAMGADVDPGAHFGVGVKAAFDDFLSVRLDVRDVRIPKNETDGRIQTDNPEVLLGLTFTLDRNPPRRLPVSADGDGDGVADPDDACPKEVGVAPDGCPPDQDKDGIVDAEDECPAESGGKINHGCPPPPCPACPACPTPDPDPDGDGLQGADDRCPLEAETVNGYQDKDGCADAIPEAARKFQGTMTGIHFRFGSAVIQPDSFKVLDDAARTLHEYPELRVRITGHTDDVGPRERNLKLSEDRARAVLDYLVEKGIAEGRLESTGKGPDEPKADNGTAAGQAENRRIEFAILR
ncbi:MAG: OmpA family protein [Polyangiaceae bacterium]|nr:OmpA family protein [Polyangiaceae bacterium]